MPETPAPPTTSEAPPAPPAAQGPAAPPTGAIPLRRYLARLIFLAAGPLVLLSAVLAAWQVADVSRGLEADAVALAQTAAQTVDRSIEARMSGLVLLSNARSMMEPGERERGYALARQFQALYGSTVIVADRETRVLFNTRLPLGEPLPPLSVPRGRSAVAETLATGRPAVGDALTGQQPGRVQVALCAPIRHGQDTVGLVLAVVDQSFFTTRLRIPQAPPDWSVRLLDSVGEPIGSSGATLQAGVAARVFRAQLSSAPWQVEVHMPSTAYWQPVWRAAAIPLLALLVATAAGLMASGVAAGRLRKAFVALAGDGAPSRTACGIAEVDSLGERLLATSEGLRESERSYRLLFNAHPHAMWVVDLRNQRFLAVNESALLHYGYSREEFLALGLADIRSRDEDARMQSVLERLGSQPPGDIQRLGIWTHRVKGGRAIQVDITSSGIEFEGVAARLVLAQDVTEQTALTRERELAREASARALAQLRDVLARVVDGFVTMDRNFVLTYANERAAELLGLPNAGAMLGRRKMELLPGRQTTPFHLACSRVLLTQQHEVLESWYEPTGRWMENRIYPSDDGVSVYFTDISERKRTQDALVKSERDFRVLAEQIPAIVYRLQLASGQMDFVSPRIRDLGYTPAEWVERPGRVWEAIHAEDRPQVEALVRHALQSGQQVLHLTYRMRDSQGQWHHMDDHAAIVRPDDGQPPFMLGVNVDVTDAHLATAALRRSELQFRRLAEQVPAIIYRSNGTGDGPALYVSPHIASLGYTAEQWTSPDGPNWARAVHPEDQPRVRAQLDSIGLQRTETTLEYRLRDAWGRWRHFIDHARLVESDEGDGVQLQGVMVEITFLKLTEQALRQAEADQRGLFEALADGVLVLDGEHQVIDANASAAHLLGYPREELLHKHLQELLPAHEKARVPSAIAALLTTASAQLQQWDKRRRGGSNFPAEVSVRPAGEGRYLMVFRDVTERKAAEQARINYQRDLSNLTQRLMSQERETSRHLAQTLHDHLGQSLAVSRLRLDAVTVAQGHQMNDTLREEWARVGHSLDQAIADVRLVLGDLRPPMLEEQGLLAALDNEVRVRSLDGARLDVLLEVDDPVAGTRWPTDVEYCAFMVAREAIVNAQLHAAASLVRVVVEGDVHRLQLEVLDDGRGIADEMRQGRPGHLGLVGMRERALAIGADFSVERMPEGGTRVQLHWQESAG